MSKQRLESYDSLSPEEKVLVDSAISACQSAYAPYSGFFVGCAILATNSRGEEKNFDGCNVENASYGAAICAERTAAVKAVSAGYSKFVSAAVYCRSKPGGSPCGICRQFLREFGPQMTILIIAGTDKSVLRRSIPQLLPESFGPEDLQNIHVRD